jgi:type VI secretion system protein ImpE
MRDLLIAGKLDEALAAARAQVKSKPADADARLLLSELCLLAGDLPKADLHAHLAGTHRPDWVQGLALYRAHLRALHARNQTFFARAMPSFPGIPTERDERTLALMVAFLADDSSGVAAAKQALDNDGWAMFIAVNDKPSQPFSGLDDRFAHAVEALMPGGDYLMIDAARIARIEVATSASRRPRDLALKKARITLNDGSAADCALPLIYPFEPEDALSNAFKLGHESDWREGQGGLITGMGQICWLAGDEAVALGCVERVAFRAA